MYGLVNQAIEDLVCSQYGEATWLAIKERAGITVPAFVGMQAYPDSTTYALVSAACEELGASADEVLEAFGEHWTLYTGKRGYGETLRLGGRSFVEFLQNLDMLHSQVALSMPALRPPSFWCTDVTARSLRLHYRSERDGLAPMVVGLVRGLGKMFDTEVEISHAVRRADGASHDEFDIRYLPRLKP